LDKYHARQSGGDTSKLDEEERERRKAEREKERIAIEEERRQKDEARRREIDEQKRIQEERERQRQSERESVASSASAGAPSASVSSPSPSSSPSDAPRRAPGRDECQVCLKKVYQTEQLIIDKRLFHKACFRCSHCKKVLSAGNYASMEGIIYCKPHFKQLFKEKGNYNEGFGKKKLTHEWAEKTGVDMASILPGTVSQENLLEGEQNTENTASEDI